MAIWENPYVQRAMPTQPRSTNYSVEKIHFVVTPTSNSRPGSVSLPNAADEMRLLRMPHNVEYIHMHLYIPPGGVWGGGDVDVGWSQALSTYESQNHITPNLPQPVPQGDPVYFGTGITPAATRVDILANGATRPLAGYEINGHQDHLDFAHFLTLVPVAQPAQDDQLVLIIGYNKYG